MKFSILLPTRNGGDFLRHCIESILSQNFVDFELVVSDNANTDATPKILEDFATEPRLKVIRQPNALSVVENWNAALLASSGDYCLVLGDDDYLLPGALQRLDKILNEHHPDCILYNGFSYIAPNTLEADGKSYWAEWHYHYEVDFKSEEFLTLPHRMSIVKDMFRFAQRIPLNMQTAVFSRAAMEKASGLKFEAPFPDHYLLNALLISAEKWLYVNERLVVIGASPKSFGHHFYKRKTSEGLDYLGISTRFPGALPGNELLNGMYSWLLKLKSNFPEELEHIHIDRGGYVLRQVYFWISQWHLDLLTLRQLIILLLQPDLLSWGKALIKALEPRNIMRLFSAVRFITQSQSHSWRGLKPVEGVNNIQDFAHLVSLDFLSNNE
ncbi:MAG TPA: glycosyltransferase family A protein [Anaerolineales bacterium]|nr:glycosyltransferase family A protein [Anaerolineales bacterium]HRQ92238.1 glycosyltransferase family A protein [Anaerolineales bacterium]